MIQQTLSIIKPDAVKQRIIGEIIKRLENNKIEIIGMKMLKLTREQAEGFYAVHKGKPFFETLVEFMISGKIVVMVLQGEDVIARYRTIMGATDYRKAAPGTLRAEFATGLTENVVHGSDATETAVQEINYFFKPEELVK
ncbi:MAG TPA: nucleoside-diphosphate kinase [bacterium]|nr:nucleoside-diphosphate kinase [bacterium]HPP86894.1 nucleoside-diphosphate kinase [bacterium]